MDKIIIAGIAVCTAISIGQGVQYHRRARKRRDAILAAAANLGWNYEETGVSLLPECRDAFHLFKRGTGCRTRNVMRGRIEDLEVVIFDYQYTCGTGKHAQTYLQTVAALRFPDDSFPSFELRPEGAMHKLGALLGYQDLDFERFPRFSAKYLLRGRDEHSVRQVFNDEVITFFEEHPGLSAEAEGDWFLMYAQNRLVDVDRLLGIAEEAMEVSSRMCARAA